MKLLLPSGEGWDEGENIKCSVRPAHHSKANCGRLRPCNLAVIPAEAGIQALNGIARTARDLNSYLWVADPRQVAFLWASKEK